MEEEHIAAYFRTVHSELDAAFERLISRDPENPSNTGKAFSTDQHAELTRVYGAMSDQIKTCVSFCTQIYAEKKATLAQKHLETDQYYEQIFKKFCFFVNADIFACRLHDEKRLATRDHLGHLIVIDEFIDYDQVTLFLKLCGHFCRKFCGHKCRKFTLPKESFFKCEGSGNSDDSDNLDSSGNPDKLSDSMVIRQTFLDEKYDSNIVFFTKRELGRIHSLELRLHRFVEIYSDFRFLFESVKFLHVVFDKEHQKGNGPLQFASMITKIRCDNRVKFTNVIVDIAGGFKVGSDFFKHLKNEPPYQVTISGKNVLHISSSFAHFFSKHLLVLDLSSSHIKSLPESVFNEVKALTKLDLSGNELNQLNKKLFAQLTRLQILKLQQNPLVELNPRQFKGLDELYYLDVSECELKDLSEKQFKYLPSLQRLFLQNNKLKKLSWDLFWNCPELIYLDLSHNELVSLEPDTFANQQRLWFLSLAWNALTSVDRLLNNCRFLHVLVLSNNDFLQMSYSFFAGFPVLGYLGVTGLKMVERKPAHITSYQII